MTSSITLKGGNLQNGLFFFLKSADFTNTLIASITILKITVIIKMTIIIKKTHFPVKYSKTWQFAKHSEMQKL